MERREELLIELPEEMESERLIIKKLAYFTMVY